MTDGLATLSRTALHDWHAAHHGRMVDFAGWSMPVHYGSIVAEHQATRAAAALFDVSHMGRLRFTGPASGSFLDNLVTRRITDMKVGQVRYGLMTNEAGNILDDVLVYRLATATGDREDYHLLVVNASNREKILTWIAPHLANEPEVQLADLTLDTAMIAVQGPRAIDLVQPLTETDLTAMKYYHGCEAELTGVAAIVSRTGYTGEDGYELTVPGDAALSIWETLLAAGAGSGVIAAGLGARDTLRLEAGMPLYGHELSEEINPLEAGLGFAVQLEGRCFIGSEALGRMAAMVPTRKRVGLELSGKRVPREHYPVMAHQQRVGLVTSGTFSPTLNKPIAMAYVEPGAAMLGGELAVDVRGQLEPARVVKLPFYRRPS